MSACLSWTVTNAAGAPLSSGNFQWDALTHEAHTIDALITEHPVETGVNVVDHVRPNPVRVTLEGLISQSPVFMAGSIRQGENLDVAAAPQPYGPPAPIVFPAPLPPNPLQFLQLAELGVIAGQTALSGGGQTSRLEGLAAVGVLAVGILGGAQNGPFQLQQASDYGMTGGPSNFTALVDSLPNPTNFIKAAIDILTNLRDTGQICQVLGGEAGTFYDNMVIEAIGVDRAGGAGGSASISVTLREIRIVSSAFVAAPKPTIPRAAPAVNKGSQAGTSAPAPPQKTALRALVAG
jgi:hypothetical protein